MSDHHLRGDQITAAMIMDDEKRELETAMNRARDFQWHQGWKSGWASAVQAAAKVADEWGDDTPSPSAESATAKCIADDIRKLNY